MAAAVAPPVPHAAARTSPRVAAAAPVRPTAGRCARARRRPGRTAPTGRRGCRSPRSRSTAPGARVTAADAAGRAARSGRPELDGVAGRPARSRHGDQRRRRRRTSLDGLEVVLPLADDHVELLDFTGRHERERTRSATRWRRAVAARGAAGTHRARRRDLVLAAGTPGFGFTHRRGVGRARRLERQHPVLRVERTAATGATSSAAVSCCCPARWCCRRGETYATPWVYFAAADDGLDGLAAPGTPMPRSLEAHPAVQPVVLNVWEAVYFDHDLDRLSGARRRARPGSGVERFVLDDGWFHDRRDDTPGSATGSSTSEVWPDGLDPLIDHVRGARHGVRAVVRARDGQPRLRPLPRPPGVDPAAAGRPRAAVRAASRCST